MAGSLQCITVALDLGLFSFSGSLWIWFPVYGKHVIMKCLNEGNSAIGLNTFCRIWKHPTSWQVGPILLARLNVVVFHIIFASSFKGKSICTNRQIRALLRSLQSHLAYVPQIQQAAIEMSKTSNPFCYMFKWSVRSSHLTAAHLKGPNEEESPVWLWLFRDK